MDLLIIGSFVAAKCRLRWHEGFAEDRALSWPDLSNSSSQTGSFESCAMHSPTMNGLPSGRCYPTSRIICKRTRPVLVLHERKSRVTLAARLVGKTAAETISVMLAVFARIEPALRKSITLDNDTAFAQHARLKTMCAMTTWFCDAYASWQKGGVENANGRLRRWLPRQIDIDKVSDEEIQDIILTANLTPRKCLGFKTPFQAILKELGKDVQIQFS